MGRGQLIEFAHGDGLDVALGGGRFLPVTSPDPEDVDATGKRLDGRDLTAEWTAKSDDHLYVWNKDDFDAAPTSSKLLGLFAPDHMEFETDRADDAAGEPSLSEMTQKAIDILSRSAKSGYFLMVEAGRIDDALDLKRRAGKIRR